MKKKPQQGGIQSDGKGADNPFESLLLYPGMVADRFRLPKFHFPGEPIPPKPPVSIGDLCASIRWYTDAIEKNRHESSTFWAESVVVKILEWLNAMGREGSEMAEAAIVNIATQSVNIHTSALNRGHEKMMMSARRRSEIPGMVSLNTQVTEEWHGLLQRIQQGSETAIPMKRAPGDHGGRRDVYKPVHLLVANLWTYMNDYRTSIVSQVLNVPIDHPEIPSLGREILSLPPFGEAGGSWKAWHKVGYKIIKHFTNRNPATHEAFQRPPLSALVIQTKKQVRTGKQPLARDLNGAWEDLARSKSSLL